MQGIPVTTLYKGNVRSFLIDASSKVQCGTKGDAVEAIFFARPPALGYVGASPAGRSPVPW